ncbi:MAG: DUF1232 domain-containing protein [Methanobrevibacter millerae]|uniref:DUF1232 domain-containing protein n=1 Tax=Methanobrevibacter millerae TaxID=230361 RepID=A0A8T3VDU1_9EURY|nr:YkvA family protein [Methanobrevibacter millerae]MBE6506289.1 DUF1232 domain-containing protein [Methanobrevibacter millerae]
MDKFKDFYDTLVDNLESYNGEYAAFIDCGPNLFKLLCDILEYDINQEIRRDICGAIAYYVVPMDIIPEQIYGPYGYIDDIFLSVYALKIVAEEYGYDFIQEIWDKPIDIKNVMDDCYEKALEVLKEEEINAILTYVGLE